MTATIQADVAVIGAGFGGSLMALVLQRIGLRPVLIDRGRHPRFAIGESSTPTADLVLAHLARDYDLPRLAPLSKYGTWMATYPHVIRGLKRGFAYFSHRPDERFAPRADHANELLVAASSDDSLADTHWLRSDVDAFLAGEVQSAGIPYLDQTRLSVADRRPLWRLIGDREGQPLEITARLLIDGTGEGEFLARALGLHSGPGQLQTRSRALFGHFVDVKPWRDVLNEQQARLEDHPFPCDRAALHHVLDEGWMWQLRFDNGVTSAGFVLDPARQPMDPSISPDEEWRGLMRRYRSIASQFAGARLVQPDGGLRRTGRLQRLTDQIAGENWALLPHTAGFIDALNSTGIAHTLCGIERLGRILGDHWGKPALARELACYATTVRTEIEFIDELIHNCFAAFGNFDLFISASMLYFAAATTYEQRRLSGQIEPGAAFLCADDPQLRTVAGNASRRLAEALAAQDRLAAAAQFRDCISASIEPFNRVGLCNPAARNMYRHTAVVKSG